MKKILILTIAIFSAINLSFANQTITQTQSPLYTDEIGRSHFLGKGGYSSVRRIDMGSSYSNAINEVANESRNIREEYTDPDFSKVIKEKRDVPVSSRAKATFSSQNRTMDASASFGNGATYLPGAGVNNSKTLYTDDIGRLHFFGKGNIIKE